MKVDILQNYHALVAKIDAFCRGVADRYDSHIACSPGCDGCCRHLTVFPVEAHVLALAVAALPAAEAEFVRKRAREATPDACPLLFGGLCLLYEHRPLICRTHGLPLLLEEGDEKRVDCCPRNFTEAESIPGNAVLSMETVNATLVAVNSVFVAALSGDEPAPDRMTIAAALLMPLSAEGDDER